MSDTALIWQLLYSKPHAEEEAEVNLRRQGFVTLVPRVRDGLSLAPLFPRYIFAGHRAGQPTTCLRSTFGIQDVVRWGDQPARVPPEVIEEIRSRMNAHSVVQLGEGPRVDPLFAKTQRKRVRALERLVAAGFRVRGPAPTADPDESASTIKEADNAEPLAGVSSPVNTAARRVAQRVRDDGIDPADLDIVTAVLAAIALAVDQQRPQYVTELEPRASPAIGARLLEMLRGELIRGWAAKGRYVSRAGMLGTLGAMEQLREAIEPDTARQLGPRLAEPGRLDFMVEIAHDLRSPLTSIMFLSELLQNGHSGEVNELQHRQLALIYSAALGLSGLVSNSIELASGGERLADTEPCPFSLTQTLEAVQDMVRPMAEEKGLTLHLRPQALDLRIGHPVALSRALLNLTCNALKFTEHGLVEIAAVAKQDAHVEFSVRDTGSGIDPQALNRLYQPFRRSRARAGFTFSRTGLGLAISRKLIAAMGSELQVETGASWGTRFYFEVDLPLAPRSRATLDSQPGACGPERVRGSLL